MTDDFSYLSNKEKKKEKKKKNQNVYDKLWTGSSSFPFLTTITTSRFKLICQIMLFNNHEISDTEQQSY